MIAVTGVTQEPNLYYMGAAGGGVWKTENYGATWENISDPYLDNDNIGAIAVAPSNPEAIYSPIKYLINSSLQQFKMYWNRTWTGKSLMDSLG